MPASASLAGRDASTDRHAALEVGQDLVIETVRPEGIRVKGTDKRQANILSARAGEFLEASFGRREHSRQD
jgi:hypothetical protein